MQGRWIWALVAGLAITGCGPRLPDAPRAGDLASSLRQTPPPANRQGQCWAEDTTPAVIETVTEQVVMRDAVQDAEGRVVEPASFRTETRQRIVQDRRTVWFRAPCPEDWTVGFTATLQRALKARGLYLAPVNGTLDAPTREAVRRYQEPLGLDSPELSLAAAQSLGIIAVPLK
jgi:hypothetical protein